MRDDEKSKEANVFKQTVSEEELKAISGGDWLEEVNTCDDITIRNIYGGNGFPNCASTVEMDSWCLLSDACAGAAIIYWSDTHTCYKAYE